MLVRAPAGLALGHSRVLGGDGVREVDDDLRIADDEEEEEKEEAKVERRYGSSYDDDALIILAWRAPRLAPFSVTTTMTTIVALAVSAGDDGDCDDAVRPYRAWYVYIRRGNASTRVHEYLPPPITRVLRGERGTAVERVRGSGEGR